MKAALLLAGLAVAHGAATYDPNAKHPYVVGGNKMTYPTDSGNWDRYKIPNTQSGDFSQAVGYQKYFRTNKNNAVKYLKENFQTCSSCTAPWKSSMSTFGATDCAKTSCVQSDATLKSGDVGFKVSSGAACDHAVYCNHYATCGRPKDFLGGGHPSAGNSCSSTQGASTNTWTCNCGSNQKTGQKNCDTCADGWANWPFCNHRVAVWTAADRCNNNGVVSANYIYELNKGFTAKATTGLHSLLTQCGHDVCGPTEQCCNDATVGFRTGSNPREDGKSDWKTFYYGGTGRTDPETTNAGNFRQAKTAVQNSFCADKSFTCCGNKVCTNGLKCLDKSRGLCMTATETLTTSGLTACYGGLTNSDQWKNPASQRPSAWCNEFQNCCDGVCCHKSYTCDRRGTTHQPYDLFGWDIRLNSPELGGAAVSGAILHHEAKWCNFNPFNGYHAMRIIVLPLMLTFGYLACAGLSVATGAPGPIKGVALVLIILSILQAYSHYWKASVLVVTFSVFTLWGTGNGDSKPGWSPLVLTIMHVLLVLVYFGLNNIVISHFGGLLWQDLQGINRYSACHRHYNYFYTDHRSIDGAHPSPFNGGLQGTGGAFEDTGGLAGVSLSGVDTTLAASHFGFPNQVTTGHFFGYCATGWLGALEFLHAFQAFFILLLVVFTAKFNFGSDAGGGTTGGGKVAPQEVAVP